MKRHLGLSLWWATKLVSRAASALCLLSSLLFVSSAAHADQLCDTTLNPSTVPTPTNSAGTPACVIQGQTGPAAPITYDTVDDSNNPVPESKGDVVILSNSSGGDAVSNWAGVAVFADNASGQGTIQLFTTAGTAFTSSFIAGAGYVIYADEGAGGMTLYMPPSEAGGACGDGYTDCYLFDITSGSNGAGGGNTGVPEPSTLVLSALGLTAFALKRACS